MTAPKLHLSVEAADGIARTIADQERTIQQLQIEKAEMEDERLMSDLRASNAIAELDARYKLRLSLLERRMRTLEEALDRVNNFAMTRASSDDVERLRERVYFIEGRVPA